MVLHTLIPDQYRVIAVVFAGALCFAGCGSADEASSAEADDKLLAELLGTDLPERSLPSAPATSDELSEPESPIEPRTGSRPAQDDSRSARRSRLTTASQVSRSGTPEAPANARRPPGERLELRLQTGDKFPLVKTVEQTLVQSSDKNPATARTRLELAMAIVVEESSADSILLGVRYSWLSYEHDINGQRLRYDSRTHRGEVPWDAIPYAGMVGNGFAFRLRRDNTIQELVGYQEFLQRCVEGIPVERRQSLLSEISLRFGDDGVANFVDDSIGVLPYDSSVDPESATRVMAGDVWTREQRLMQPVPTYLTTTYRLTDLNEQTAEIDITGRIASGETMDANQETRIRITGGHSLGQCIVDRSTGLPVDVQLTRHMTMTINTWDSPPVVQDKQIITTIRAFPEARAVHADAVQPSQIRPASAVVDRQAGPATNSPRPPQSAVQAKYPD
jgi:hypothetical protein